MASHTGRPRGRALRLLAGMTAGALLAGTSLAAAQGAIAGPQATVPYHAPVPRSPAARDVRALRVRPARVPRYVLFRPVHTSWPAPLVAVLRLDPARRPVLPVARPGRAHPPLGMAPATVSLRAVRGPVWAQAVRPADAAMRAQDIRVHVLPHAAAVAAGVRGVLFTAAPARGAGGPVRLGLSYAGFSQVSGGAYGWGLGLAELPACAVTTPSRPSCQTQKPLRSVNDAATQTVSTRLTLSRAGGVVLAAVTAHDDGGGLVGTYSATSLRASGTWAEGGASGSFTYSYPMSVPPAAGGLVPDLGLSYDSGTVDGQTAATQPQASWVGDGWSTPQSYIEQSFIPCADAANPPVTTSDECYNGPIITMTQDGSSDSLVCGSSFSYTADSTCTASDDQGQVITLHYVKSGTGSGTQYNDYWTVTGRDGTTYYYGMNQLPGWDSSDSATDSVDSEPVFGVPGSQCGSSPCTMAYRWNLDYVTDVHGNAMAYYYDQSTNGYAEDGKTTSPAVSYVRDSYLDHIDYGFTAGNAYSGNAPDEVKFKVKDRCLGGASVCDPLNASTASQWPDVPYMADYCAVGQTGCQVTGPTYWSTVMLQSVITQQWNGSGYTPVDTWALKQDFPQAQDGTNPALWLASITHTGDDTTAGGSAVTLKPVRFTPISLANRVDKNHYPALYRDRIDTITSETGAVTTVSYETPSPSCTPTSHPSEADNHWSCFPVYWSEFDTPGSPDWFNQWAVQSVAVSDPSGGSGGLFTEYKYNDPAWHYDDNELVQPKYQTYGQWRGYQDVQTFTGTGTDTQTKSETTYYQGMSDDNNSTAVTLADSQGGSHDDTNQLAGAPLETTGYDYAGTGIIENSTIYSYWVSAAVASRDRSAEDLPPLTANATGEVEKWTRQAITDTATTTWRDTETDTTYDNHPSDADFGLPLYVFAHGDLSQPSQQTCTSTIYAAPNTAKNLTGLAAEIEVDAAPCGGSNPNGATAPTPGQINALTAPTGLSRPAQVISDTHTYYDDPPVLASNGLAQPTDPTWPQAAPGNTDASVVQEATGYANGAFAYITKTATAYDSYGRPVASYDANGNETTTSYTMTGGSTTAQTVTNPLGQATTTAYDPLRELPVTITDPNQIKTTLQYNVLGWLTGVWGYNRDPAKVPANEQYAYQVSSSGPPVVTSQQLTMANTYITSTTLYDALLRVRQTQTPTPAGGILVSDNFYDTRGWLYKTNTNWYDSTASPGTTILDVLDSQVPDQHETDFDGLGRPVLVTDYDNSSIVSRTATAYYGDRVTTVPNLSPGGSTSGTPTSTLTDALGRTTELDQYTTQPTVTIASGPPVTVAITGGTTKATTYDYNTRGELGTITDAATGEQWGKTYDLPGQVTGTTDPNGGATTLTYDNNGNLLSTTGADNHTISYTYDALNRKTGEYDGPTSASPPIAAWVYDNANNAVTGMDNPIGHLTTETSYNNGHPYTIQQQGFTLFGESEGETITLPGSEGNLAGSYALTASYDPTTGLPVTTTYPGAPGGALPSETTRIVYNSLDMPSGMNSNLAAYVQKIQYTAWSQVQTETIGTTSQANQATITNTYDPNTGNLTGSTAASGDGATTYDTTTYGYDTASNITTETDTRSTGQSETQCFGYNTLDRLTQAWTATDNCAANPSSNNGATVGDPIPGSAYWTTWKYNTLGQRTSQTGHNLTGGTNTVTAYTYNGNGTNQPNTLTSTSTTGPSGTSTAAYSYDPAGNTLTRNLPAGNQTLTWTDDGKLTTDTTSAGTTHYIYDADGNILLQKDPGQSTLYLFGGTEQITATGTTITGTRFIPLPGGGQAVRTSTGFTYEFTNQQNTGTLTLDSGTHNPQWRQFTPYGAPRGTPPASWPDTNGFLGKPTDQTTGLTILGARFYDPDTGQFLSLDPILDPTNPAQLNGYSYAAANPITNTDPTGTRPSCYEHDCNPSNYQHGNGSHVNPTGDGTGGGPGNSGPSPISSSAPTTIAGITLPVGYPHAATIAADFKTYLAQYAATHPLTRQETASAAGRFDALETMCNQNQHWESVCGWSLSRMLLNDYENRAAAAYGIFEIPGLANMAKELDSAYGFDSTAEWGAQDVTIEIDDAQISQNLACGGQSFTATTQVLLASGKTRPIASLKPGDKILATNTHTGVTTAEPVAAVLVHYDTNLYNLTIRVGRYRAVIHTTANHLFWNQITHTWTPADSLQLGARLHTPSQTIASILHGRSPKTHTGWMWDLTIPQEHDFYVVVSRFVKFDTQIVRGASDQASVLVHNSNDCGGQIGYNSDMLSNAAYNARIGSGIGSGRNVAAAQVAGLDEPVIGISRGSGYHAENDILNHSKRKGSIQARLPPFTANGNRVLYVSRCLMKSYHPELRLHGQSHGALILQ
jgi:RHS repeat-associated protein